MLWIVIIFTVVCLVLLIVFARLFFISHNPDSGDLPSQAKDIKSGYSTSMGRIAAKHQRDNSIIRIETANTKRDEITAVIGMHEKEFEAQHKVEHLQNNLRRSEEQADSQHELLLAQNELTVHLLGSAKGNNLDLPSYVEWQKKLALDKADLDKQWVEAEQQLKAGFIYQLQAHQHLALMTEYIGRLYDRAEELREKGKQRELDLIEEHISFMEEDFRGRQRLLQAANRQELQGSDEDTKLEGDGRETVEAEQVEIPSKRGRGRPKGSPNKRGGES